MSTISIVTPTLNSALFLKPTIESISSQTHSDFEHIVVDSCSTDGTTALARAYRHVRLIVEKDNGQSEAINKGFRLATGDILAWQNADDLYCPDAFDTVTRYFDEHPDVHVVYGGYQVIDVEGNKVCTVHPPQWNEWLFAHGRFVPPQPTCFWRREVYEAVGEVNETLHYCMDVDFYARAAKRFRFAKLPVLLGKFRVHQNSKTQNAANYRRVRKEYHGILKRHYSYGCIDEMVFWLFQERSRLTTFLTRNVIKR